MVEVLTCDTIRELELTEQEVKVIQAIRQMAFGKVIVHVTDNTPIRMIREHSEQL